MALMMKLYEIAKKEMESSGRCNTNNCISALKITYGLKGGRIIFYGQATYLVNSSNQSANRMPFRTQKLDKPYLLSGSTLQTISIEQMNKYAKQYINSVRVRRFKDNGAYETAIQMNGTSWENDSKSMLFSFQEIFMLYHSAYNIKPEQGSANYCRDIYIHNGGANYRRQAWYFWQRWRVKHTLFITNDQESSLTLSNNDRQGANLGHLCPPSCDIIYYNTP